jgi:hypothetical protein
MLTKTNLLILLGLLSAASCNMSDDYQDLGNNYQYIGEGGNLNYIIGNQSVYPKVIEFESDEKFIVLAQQPKYEEYKYLLGEELSNKYEIYAQYIADSVTLKKDYAKFNSHQIRESKPLYSLLKARGLTDKNMPEDWAIREVVADSILKTDSYYQDVFSRKVNYWIIDKESDRLYGPYNLAQFDNQCKLLKITLELNTKEPDRVEGKPSTHRPGSRRL